MSERCRFCGLDYEPTYAQPSHQCLSVHFSQSEVNEMVAKAYERCASYYQAAHPYEEQAVKRLREWAAAARRGVNT